MKISVRQICFITFVYTVAAKLLNYPTYLAQTGGRDLLFSSLITFIVNGAAVWAVAYLSSRTDKTLTQMLRDTFGDIAARIIIAVFGLFFLFCALLPLLEQKQYVHSIFYDTVPSILVFLPFFAFSIYAACKNFTNIGRCADICLPVFVFCFVALIAMGMGEARFENLAPVLKTPPKSVLTAAVGSLCRFAEPCRLLFFVGRFEYKKGDAARITLSYAAAAAAVLLFIAVFFSVYGGLSGEIFFAASKISLYFSAINVVGRVDLIALYALELVQLFALVLDIQLAVYCFKSCLYPDDLNGEPKYTGLAVSVCVNSVLLALAVVLDNSLTGVAKFYADWGWIVFLIFTIIAPVACWALKKGVRRG